MERDFRLLSDAGLQLLRVFPLWPDFQPIHLLRGGGGRPVEFRHGEAPLPDDPLRQAGLSHQAMEQFATFLDLAEKHRLKLLIGLLTGWMSGRLHLPPALEDLNPLTDPVAIQWEVRFVREFVGHFKAHPAIIGWDLGNECNCMGSATREQAYVWAATIANAIRAADPTRPVVSGCTASLPRAWLAHHGSGGAHRSPLHPPLPHLHAALRPGPREHHPHHPCTAPRVSATTPISGKPPLPGRSAPWAR